VSEHQSTAADPTATIAEEYAATPYEPLLPIEKKLIAVSLILGVTLLGVLSWASSVFFPITPHANGESRAPAAHAPEAPPTPAPPQEK